MRKMYAQDTNLRIRRGEKRNERGEGRIGESEQRKKRHERASERESRGSERRAGTGRERERDILIVKKTVCVRRRREIRWTRMRTLLCPKRAYTVGTLMSARMKAWAFLCLSFVKLPQ